MPAGTANRADPEENPSPGGRERDEIDLDGGIGERPEMARSGAGPLLDP